MGNCCDIKPQKQPILNKHLESEEENRELSIKLKEEGNKYMQSQMFKEAIEAYSEAIKIFDKESIYYSNRAVAYRVVGQYQLVEKDAFNALELDKTNVRAYYILGTVLLITAQQTRNLERAIDGIHFLEQAQKYIDKKPQLQGPVNQNFDKAMVLKINLEKYDPYQKFQVFKDKMIRSYGQQINLHKWKFQGQQIPYIPESSECYSCIITQESMTEPVLLSSGHTYEKSAIMECIRINGAVDPNTRQQIGQAIIYNIQLKDGIRELLNNNLEFV